MVRACLSMQVSTVEEGGRWGREGRRESRAPPSTSTLPILNTNALQPNPELTGDQGNSRFQVLNHELVKAGLSLNMRGFCDRLQL